MRLRAAGATHVRVGGLEVKFAPLPPATHVDVTHKTIQQIVDAAKEDMMDHREVEEDKEMRRDKRVTRELTYGHS